MKNERLLGNVLKYGVIGFVVLSAAGLWYFTIGRKPRLHFSAPIAEKTAAPTICHLGEDELILVTGEKVALYNVKTGAQKWSVTLPSGAGNKPPVVAQPALAAPQRAVRKFQLHQPDPLLKGRVDRRFAKLKKWAMDLDAKRAGLKTEFQVATFNEEAARYHAELGEARIEAALLNPVKEPETAAPVAEVEVTEPFHFAGHREVIGSMLWIWVVDGRRIVALERATGRFVKETAILGEQEKILRGEGAFFVVSNIASGRQQITTVRLKDGNVSTLDLAASRREAATIWQEDQVPTPNIQAACTDFLPSGEGLLRADIRLVEKKVVERAAMRANDDKALDELEKSTNGASSSDAVKLAQVLANDAQRDLTGGKERIDESTYEVTLRRVAGAPVAEWKGRVQGRPELFASASLTLLSAGNQLLAFDLSNKKLWDTKLVQPVRSREHSEPAPYLEHADRLYFADQAFLTAFERATGRVLWRLPSVGITALQIDEAGKLYVSSANATADSLLYSQESRLSDVTPPVTIKLDPRNGKILWKAEKYEECYVSGGSIYASRSVRNMQDVTNAVFDPKKAVDTRYTLYKLDAGNGKAQWGWFQNRRPLHVLSRGRTVILLFEKELQVIKSIAL